MAYTISWEARGVVWTFHGVLTGEDAIQANLDIYGDPRFDDLAYQIVSLLGVERFDVSADSLDTAAAMDDAAALSNPSLVVAVVAATQDAVQVARMYQSAMQTSSWKVEIFGSVEEAKQWCLSHLKG